VKATGGGCIEGKESNSAISMYVEETDRRMSKIRSTLLPYSDSKFLRKVGC
jgi:hypothetical protein